jgi:hypothetical protein
MKEVSRIGACLLLVCFPMLLPPVVSQTLAEARQKGGSAPPPGGLPCDQDPNVLIRPTKYTVALDLHNQLIASGPQTREGTIVVFVRDDTGTTYPLIQLRQRPHYALLCRSDPSTRAHFAGIPTKARIMSQRRDDDLLNQLHAAKQDDGNDLRPWEAIAFRQTASGADFIDWPATYRQQIPDKGMITALIQGYVEATDGRTLLADDQVVVLLPGVSPRLWVAKTPTAVASPARPTDPPTAQDGPSVRPEPSQERNVQFVIGFRNKEAWKDIKLNEVISTFEYCNDKEGRIDPNFNYVLQCRPGSDRKIPVRIRGFQLVFVDSNEAKQIDNKLHVVGFRTPYPHSWGRSTTSDAEVPGGPLADVLARPIQLDQAVPNTAACTDSARVSVAAIVGQELAFSAPPCRPYQIEFAPGLIDNSARVSALCLAGTPEPQLIRNGRVTCWQSKRQAVPIQLQVELLAGFQPVNLSLPQATLDQQHVTLTFDALSDALLPVWPYPGSSPVDGFADRGEAPRFVPTSVEYLDQTGKSCQQPVEAQRVDRSFSMPSLKTAGCRAVPSKARITLVRDATATAGPPPKAFQDTFRDEYDIRNVAVGTRTRDIAALKVSLPIRFSAEKAAEYAARFRSGTGNRAPAAGVYVFAGIGERCGPLRDGKFIGFKDRANQQQFTWPQNAAVYDTRSTAEQPMLSVCAPARVESEGNESYLTFDLEPTVASGPRRVIIIANNQSLQRGGVSQVLREALRKLVDAADAEHKNRSPLSPISVYSMDNQENLRPLFTGEDAARRPADSKRKIADMDTVAPKTPDFQLLKNQPELKDIERLILVMDGSNVGDSNSGQLFQIARRLPVGEGGGVAFYITSSCRGWPTNEVRGFECSQLPQGDLAGAFIKLIEKREDMDDRTPPPPTSPTASQPAPPSGPVRPPQSIPPGGGARPQ